MKITEAKARAGMTRNEVARLMSRKQIPATLLEGRHTDRELWLLQRFKINL